MEQLNPLLSDVNDGACFRSRMALKPMRHQGLR
jgi:hypothetical protein